MIKRILTAGALAIALNMPAFAQEYIIDTENEHASINFKADHSGWSFLTGRFDTFSGSFVFDPEKPTEASVSVEIDTASVNTNLARRDNHLRSDDFFDVENHPTATFKSTDVKVTGDKTAIISGDLTIRGITKNVDINTTHVGGGKDRKEKQRHGFTGTATIIPADFGMTHRAAKAPLKLILEAEGIQK